MIYNPKETGTSDSPMSVGVEYFDFLFLEVRQRENLSDQTYPLTNDGMNAFEKRCRF